MLSASGGFASLTRGSALDPLWGLGPQTAVIGSRSALAMNPNFYDEDYARPSDEQKVNYDYVTPPKLVKLSNTLVKFRASLPSCQFTLVTVVVLLFFLLFFFGVE